MHKDIWNRIWRDRHGRIVIWQWPNPPLYVWIVFTVLSLLFNGHVADFFSWIADLGLLVWALLEIFKAVNYFRRGLGIIVLVFTIMSIIKNF